MNIRRNRNSRDAKGAVLVEGVTALAVLALFFSALYGLNARCLLIVRSDRQLLQASQALQDRLELMRTGSWTQVASADYIRDSILNSASQSENNLANLVETITVQSYPDESPTPITVRRTGGVATIVSSNANLAAGTLVKVKVACQWKGHDRTHVVEDAGIFCVSTR